MNWKKSIIGIIVLVLAVRVVFIVDVYVNEGRNLKLQKAENGKYKANLYLRNFYIFTQSGDINAKKFMIKKFPKLSYSDGLNYGRNISGLPSWQNDESERLGLETNSIVIPYDWNIVPFLNIGQIHEEAILEVQTNDKAEPISVKYYFLKESEKE